MALAPPLAGLGFALGLGLVLAAPGVAGEPVTIAAEPVTAFGAAVPGDPVDGVVFRGGAVLSSDHPDFGGISGLSMLDAARFVMVTDRGSVITGRLAPGAEPGLIDTRLAPLTATTGDAIPGRFSADAEAVEIIVREGLPSAMRVGFESNTRVADYALDAEGIPTGPAQPVAIPDWLRALRTNESIESLCIAPPASPIAGSTLIITENHVRTGDAIAATLLGVADRGDLDLERSGRFLPTDCAFAPDGDLLVLERTFSLLGFAMQVRRIPADAVRAGARMDGEIILSGSGRDVDNMEGLGVRTMSDGEVRMLIVSDDNFLAFQRTLLLEFALPETGDPAP
ncbi:esterase-like activity of phytase family protein [Pelagibacterium montanilacus]|uniref:esterase-like activity of phytase family protein n=1 Tax=Pelagibacterium montanilacus TaxID=2185280 RepID=UPI000F8E94C8|nr:esterase-like activity of phytase family protein [Pelagibacterium montanilacus]